MTEQALRFGPEKKLIGILNCPERFEKDFPTALILNAGIVHRVGPFRIHVDLARALANQGIASLRLDLSGLGDSEVRKDLPIGMNRAELDLIDAMDAVREGLGVDKFVLIGLCSGAYNAHQVAVTNQRVAGAVFLDGIAYETKKHARRKLRRRLRYRSLRNAVKRRIVPNALTHEQRGGVDSAEFFTIDKPAEKVAQEIQSMVDRQMQLLYAFTEGYKEVSSADQFREMFNLQPDGEQLQVDYYPNFEHTFSLTPHREIIVNRVATWYANRFGALIQA